MAMPATFASTRHGRRSRNPGDVQRRRVWRRAPHGTRSRRKRRQHPTYGCAALSTVARGLSRNRFNVFQTTRALRLFQAPLGDVFIDRHSSMSACGDHEMQWLLWGGRWGRRGVCNREAHRPNLIDGMKRLLPQRRDKNLRHIIAQHPLLSRLL